VKESGLQKWLTEPVWRIEMDRAMELNGKESVSWSEGMADDDEEDARNMTSQSYTVAQCTWLLGVLQPLWNH
jgi:hypothetical protein